MNDVNGLHFEGFEYAVTEINKFICTAGIFTMMLKNSSRIISHTPDDPQAFMDWLSLHNVADIRKTG